MEALGANDANAMQKQAKWVNENAHYVYLGAGMKWNNARADTVVLHEKPGAHHNQGMNILYGDGHVEWHTLPSAMQEIERSRKAQKGL